MSPGKGIKPEWLNLPRRRCDNCGKRYKPARPETRFCSPTCSSQFHRHSGAYMKLKAEVAKEIARQMGIDERCASCKGTGHLRGKITRPAELCPDCHQGKRLTEYGREVVAALRRYLPALPTPE